MRRCIPTVSLGAIRSRLFPSLREVAEDLVSGNLLLVAGVFWPSPVHKAAIERDKTVQEEQHQCRFNPRSDIGISDK